MIQGLATPVDLKLQLVPILQHIHHDAILASSARQQLVISYPSPRMVIVSLYTFTLLAASSLVETPKQIQLLLQCLKSDPRRAVKRLAVQDLKLLAKKDLLSLEQDAVFGLESLLVLCSQDDSPGAQFTVKIALNCVVKLAKGWPHLSRSVVDTLLTQLHISQDTARFLMCHCLAAIAMQLPVLDDRMLGDFMELYKQIGLQPQQAQQPLKPQPQQQPQNAYTRF
ncbi:integrator complex subunit 7 [Cricetulus griseus]|uniref:Integrator complex subunit 7 n=1 Tax=Cricetulus griseus TaxID=10029 RepID=A0A061IAV4_CRIGR|nr:integrator complex subunit 7 [Cricetulus griseus]